MRGGVWGVGNRGKGLVVSSLVSIGKRRAGWKGLGKSSMMRQQLGPDACVRKEGRMWGPCECALFCGKKILRLVVFSEHRDERIKRSWEAHNTNYLFPKTPCMRYRHDRAR